MKKILTLLLFLFFSAILGQNALAITIILDDLGGTPMSNTVGNGSLTEIVTAASAQWTNAIRDDFTLTLHYGYASIPAFGANYVNSVDGGRIIESTILFDSDFPFVAFLDSTPLSNEEYQTYNERTRDFGVGPINDARYLTDPSGLGAETFDLLSVALHEIGHALGLSQANPAYVTEASDGYINITGPLMYKGSALPQSSNFYGPSGHFEYPIGGVKAVMGDIMANTRNQLSDIDILAVAQVGKFRDTKFTLATVPEPSSLMLVFLAVNAIVFLRRTIAIWSSGSVNRS